MKQTSINYRNEIVFKEGCAYQYMGIKMTLLYIESKIQGLFLIHGKQNSFSEPTEIVLMFNHSFSYLDKGEVFKNNREASSLLGKEELL